MVDFLVLIEELISYDKKTIDRGETPPEIYDLCCCIRETFCLSYAIRKENNLYILSINDQVVVKFNGYKLKYLGSDERSQAILLNKAIKLIQSSSQSKISDWKISTPGIFVKNLEKRQDVQLNFLSLDIYKHLYLIISNEVYNKQGAVLIEDQEFRVIDNHSLFIILSHDYSNKSPINYEDLKKKYKISFISSKVIKNPQDQILYINYKLDTLN